MKRHDFTREREDREFRATLERRRLRLAREAAASPQTTSCAAALNKELAELIARN